MSFLVVVSEFSYGDIQIGNYHLDFPNLSSSVAKVYANKFMRAFEDEDLDKISILYRDLNADGSIIEDFKKFYEHYDVIDYNYSYFFHNGFNYTIVYQVTLTVLGEEMKVDFYIVPLKNDVIFSPNIYGVLDKDVIKDYPEILDIYVELISSSVKSRFVE